MRRRITLLVLALMMALALSFGDATAAFAGPDCTGPNKKPPCKASKQDTGGANFVSKGKKL